MSYLLCQTILGGPVANVLPNAVGADPMYCDSVSVVVAVAGRGVEAVDEMDLDMADGAGMVDGLGV